MSLPAPPPSPAESQLYLYPIPESLGGGVLALRELTYAKHKQIRAQHLGSSKRQPGLDQMAAFQEALVVASLAGCDVETAANYGITGTPNGDLVLVDDSNGGRLRLYAAIPAKLRDLAAAAHEDIHALSEDEIGPLIRRRSVRTL